MNQPFRVHTLGEEIYKDIDSNEYLNGLSLTKISEKYGLNRHTLARNLKEYGIDTEEVRNFKWR